MWKTKNEATEEELDQRERERQAAMSADLLRIAETLRWRDQDTGARRQ